MWYWHRWLIFWPVRTDYREVVQNRFFVNVFRVCVLFSVLKIWKYSLCKLRLWTGLSVGWFPAVIILAHTCQTMQVTCHSPHTLTSQQLMVPRGCWLKIEEVLWFCWDEGLGCFDYKGEVSHASTLLKVLL